MTNKLGTCCLNRCISKPMNSQLLVKAKGKDSQSPHSCASGCHYKRMKQGYFGVWGRQSARTQQCCECVRRDNSDLGVASSLLHALKCLPRHCTHCTASSVHWTTSSLLMSHSLSLFSLLLPWCLIFSFIPFSLNHSFNLVYVYLHPSPSFLQSLLCPSHSNLFFIIIVYFSFLALSLFLFYQTRPCYTFKAAKDFLSSCDNFPNFYVLWYKYG